MSEYYGGGMCPACGAALEPYSSFCTICGAPLGNGQPDNPSAGACPACGAALESDALFCVACGYQLSASASSPEHGACTSCGAPLEPGAVFCVVCGQRVKGPEKRGQTDRVVTRPPVETTILVKKKEGNDPSMEAKLVTLTQEEALRGCRKQVRTSDGRVVTIDVPPHTNISTKLDLPGMGKLDERTGQRGPLRVTFLIPR